MFLCSLSTFIFKFCEVLDSHRTDHKIFCFLSVRPKLLLSVHSSQQHSKFSFFTSCKRPSFSPINTVSNNLTRWYYLWICSWGGSWFESRLEQVCRGFPHYVVYWPFLKIQLNLLFIVRHLIITRYSVVEWIMNQEIKIHIHLR